MRVLVVDHAPVAVHNIQRLLESEQHEVVGTAEDGETAVVLATSRRPGVVLLDIDLPGIDGIQAAEMIRQQAPEILIVVMGLDDDEQSRALARRAGADDYLVKPFSADELLTTLGALSRDEAGAGAETAATADVSANHESPPADPGVPPASPAPSPYFPVAPDLEPAPPISMPPAAFSLPTTGPAVPPAGEVGGQPGREHTLIACVAGKGGVGTTVLATNLAILIAREGGRHVVIVDLDLQRGDVGPLLRVNHERSLADVALLEPGQAPLHEAVIATPHRIHALLAPPQGSGPSEPLSEAHVISVLDELRQQFDVVIIDVPAHLDEAAATALHSADRVVVITSMSELGVQASRGMLNSLRTIGLRAAPVLVLNRVEANSDLTRTAVEEMLATPVAVQFPYDPMVISTSINRATPFAEGNPDAQASRRLRELGGILVGLSVPENDDGTPTLPRFDDGRKRKGRKGLFGFARA